jgi:hypothetical protein
MADQAQAQGLPKQVESVLRSADVPDQVKAQAWDAFFKSKDENAFKTSFGAIKELPDPVKAQLWDLKSHKTATPPSRPSAMGPATPTQPTKMTPPAPVQAAPPPQAAATPPPTRPQAPTQPLGQQAASFAVKALSPLVSGMGRNTMSTPILGQAQPLVAKAAGMAQGLPLEAAATAGVMQGLTEAGIDLTSPQNLALMFGTFGLGKAAQQAPKLKRILNVLKAGASVGFGAAQLGQLSTEIPEAAKAYSEQNWVEFGRHVAKTITDLGFGLGASKEAFHSTKEVMTGGEASAKEPAPKLASKRDITPATGELPAAEARVAASGQSAGQVPPAAAPPTEPAQTQKFGVPRETKVKKSKTQNVGIPGVKTSGNAKTKVPAADRTVETPGTKTAVEPPDANFEKELAEALEQVKSAKSPAEAPKPAGKATKGKAKPTPEAQPAAAQTPATPPPAAKPKTEQEHQLASATERERQITARKEFEGKLAESKRKGTGKKAESVEPPPTRAQATEAPTKAKPEAAPAPQTAPKVAAGVSTPEAVRSTLGSVIQTARAQGLKKIIVHGLDSGGNIKLTRSLDPMSMNPEPLAAAFSKHGVTRIDVDPGRSDIKAWSVAVKAPEAVPQGTRKLPKRKPPVAAEPEAVEPPESRSETLEPNESYQVKKPSQAFQDAGIYDGDYVIFKGKNSDGSYSFKDSGGSMAKVYASEADVMKATGKKKVSAPVSEEAPKPPAEPEKPPAADLIEKNKEGLQKAGIKVSEKRRKGQRGSFSLQAIKGGMSPGSWVSPKGEVTPLGGEHGAYHHEFAGKITGKRDDFAAMDTLLKSGWIRVRGTEIESPLESVADTPALAVAVQEAVDTAKSRGDRAIWVKFGGRHMGIELKNVADFLANPRKYMRHELSKKKPDESRYAGPPEIAA